MSGIDSVRANTIWRPGIRRSLFGYRTAEEKTPAKVSDSTTDQYAAVQEDINPFRVQRFLLPLLRKQEVKVVLDVGCGVGAMVLELTKNGYNTYGVDLVTLGHRWSRMNLDRDRYFYVDSSRLTLPFRDEVVDFVYRIGVIEHVGTSNGHSDRLPDYHLIRRQWIREIYRVVRPGGRILIGGPNKGFPVDTAHGPDSRASSWERVLSRHAGVTVHKTWSENFLWDFKVLNQYL